MKQVLIFKGKAVTKEVPIPALAEGMVLVRVHYSFVSSGTEAATLSASGMSVATRVCRNFKETTSKVFKSIEKHGVGGTASLIRGTLGKFLEVGYSCSGQVLKVSPNSGFSSGDWVACAGAGFAVHGEFVAVPKNLVVRLSGPEKLMEASAVAMASVALQGFRRTGLGLGETVCVIGLGLIGLLTVQIARHAGCRVFGIDLEESRLKLGLKLGCGKVFDAFGSEDVRRGLLDLTSKYGVDAAIITAASGSGAVVDQAMSITRKRGKVVVVGDVKFDFSRENFYRKELALLMSCSYGPGRYDQEYEQVGTTYPYDFVRWTETRNMEFIVSCIERGDLDVVTLINKIFNITQADEAYNCLKKEKPVGIVLSYVDNSGTICKKKASSKFRCTLPSDSCIGVAMIGAGGFAKTKLLPILKNIADVNIKWVVGTKSASVLNVAKQFSIPCVTTDMQEVLDDPLVLSVIIASPHKFHARQSLAALKAGKAVFCEKPAAVSFDEFDELKNFLHNNPESVYKVDFNRSYAPFIEKIFDASKNRSTPLLINYRMNVGGVPEGHWLKLPEHGGRVIGEMCHVFELFMTLTISLPVSVSVSVVRENKSMGYPENVCANVSFRDGSVGNVTYTALGSSVMNKERMEVFWEDKSVVMDDFCVLKGYGLPSSFNDKVFRSDKGHEAILKNFFSGLITEDRNEERHVRIRLLYATEVSLHVDRLTRIGGGFHNFELDQLDKRLPCVA